jgi:hypothetical protein
MRRTMLAAAAAVLTLTGCSGLGDPGDPDTRTEADARTGGTTPGEPAELAQDDLGAVPQWSGPYTKPLALADDLQPPTNSWISPAVFDPADRPVFTGVLSVRLSADQLGAGLPQPETSDLVVMGAHRDDVVLDLDSDGYEVTRLDEVSATVTYTQDEQAIGEVILAEGWPYLHYRALTDQLVGIAQRADGYRLSTEDADADDEQTDDTDPTGDADAITLAAGEDLFLWAEPKDGDPATGDLLRDGAVPLTGTSVDYEVGERETTTTLTYATEGGPTVLAAPPHAQLPEDAEPVEAAYPSILGDLRLVSGPGLTSTVPTQEPVSELDLGGLDDEERALVEEALETDVAELSFPAPDSYHGGKEVQRAANLVVLAEQLGRDDLASTAREATITQLDTWFDPEGCGTRQERCFHYDETLGGMVGLAPSYGSDEFNDHHFHYGHFLYAAGLLAADDPELAERWAPVADLVARDYGAPQASSHFPAHRTFDAWRGHSFASGTAPFADGNNQESSSEAVNGYVGLALWAQARGDEELGTHARWLLSQETASTLAYWIDPELPEGFGPPSVSLNWQGKRDFTTFFSPDPSAIVGIQFIPMGPTQVDYLSRVPEAVADMVNHVGELEPGRPLVDLDVAALAIVDPEAAEAALQDFTRDDIDPGLSWSYLQALVLTQEN